MSRAYGPVLNQGNGLSAKRKKRSFDLYINNGFQSVARAVGYKHVKRWPTHIIKSTCKPCLQ